MSTREYYFDCPHCGQRQSFTNPDIQGKKVACADCGGKTQLPEYVDSLVLEDVAPSSASPGEEAMKGEALAKTPGSGVAGKALVMSVILLLGAGGVYWLNQDRQDTGSKKAEAQPADVAITAASNLEDASVPAQSTGMEAAPSSKVGPKSTPATPPPVPAGGFNHLSDQTKTYTDGKDGYMIITTEELKSSLKVLPDFVAHKSENRDFRVFISTESDWAGRSAAG